MTVGWGFDDKLRFSQGRRGDDDKSLLLDLIDGSESVRDATPTEQKKGIDYVVVLARGAEIRVDAKRRDAGASEYWHPRQVHPSMRTPEVALEIWSVYRERIGWALDEAKSTDYVLFTFDVADHDTAYLRPFQLVRIAFRRNLRDWARRFRPGPQRSHRNGRSWRSDACFVPVSVLDAAIDDVSRTIAAEDGPAALACVGFGDDCGHRGRAHKVDERGVLSECRRCDCLLFIPA